MDAASFYDLVISARDGENPLIETGELRAVWIAEYRSFLQQARAEWLREAAWPRKAFEAMHQATVHLPLRYNVWSRFEKRRNIATESALSSVRLETELLLWSCLCDLRKWPRGENGSASLLDRDDCSLIDLCFGAPSPVGVVDETTSFRGWQKEYERALRVAHVKWKDEPFWPQVLSMAVRFASVYVDLFQIREVDLSASYLSEAQQVAQINEVVEGLRIPINNEYVLSLIRIWLESSGMNRDGSGLPAIGVVRARTGQFVSVRTISEMFLEGIEAIPVW